jgi:DNA-binding NarL/FixJ family response regulator
VIRVVLVDDQPLVRAGLSRILGPEPDIEIVAECADGSEVLAAVAATSPTIVVMDVRMKNVDGTEATRLVRALPDAPPVLTLTTFDDDEVVAASLAAGASGFILKDAPGEDLIAAVRAVALGGAWLDPTIAGKVIEAYRSTGIPRAQQQAKLRELTEREVGVLELIGRGATNAEIAERLFISEGTVKSHIGHIFTKLDLRDRAAAIVFAFDHHLVEPAGPGSEARDPTVGG